jgi:hypothetical protein
MSSNTQYFTVEENISCQIIKNSDKGCVMFEIVAFVDLSLALSKVPNIVSHCPQLKTEADPVYETLFCSYTEFGMVDKVHKHRDYTNKSPVWSPFCCLWWRQTASKWPNFVESFPLLHLMTERDPTSISLHNLILPKLIWLISLWWKQTIETNSGKFTLIIWSDEKE